MSRSILLTLPPEIMVKVLNAASSLLVRKLFPKGYVGWVYLHCSNSTRKVLYSFSQPITKEKCFVTATPKEYMGMNPHYNVNGKVVARFWCDKTEELVDYGNCYLVNKDYPHTNRIARQSCLDFVTLKNYLKGKNGFVVYLTNEREESTLEIFDRPRELSEFKRYHEPGEHSACWKCKRFGTGCVSCSITKAPINYCWVEGE